ncbi:hypothetical protein D3C85_1655330 [compost metagenome]
MTTHLFQLICQAQGQLRQGLLWLDIDRHRQNVEHRTGGGERRRSHAAHKDKARCVIQPTGQAAQPKSHQREGQIRALNLRARCGQLTECAAIGQQFET